MSVFREAQRSEGAEHQTITLSSTEDGSFIGVFVDVPISEMQRALDEALKNGKSLAHVFVPMNSNGLSSMTKGFLDFKDGIRNSSEEQASEVDARKKTTLHDGINDKPPEYSSLFSDGFLDINSNTQTRRMIEGIDKYPINVELTSENISVIANFISNGLVYPNHHNLSICQLPCKNDDNITDNVQDDSTLETTAPSASSLEMSKTSIDETTNKDPGCKLVNENSLEAVLPDEKYRTRIFLGEMEKQFYDIAPTCTYSKINKEMIKCETGEQCNVNANVREQNSIAHFEDINADERDFSNTIQQLVHKYRYMKQSRGIRKKKIIRSQRNPLKRTLWTRKKNRTNYKTCTSFNKSMHIHKMSDNIVEESTIKTTVGQIYENYEDVKLRGENNQQIAENTEIIQFKNNTSSHEHNVTGNKLDIVDDKIDSKNGHEQHRNVKILKQPVEESKDKECQNSKVNKQNISEIKQYHDKCEGEDTTINRDDGSMRIITKAEPKADKMKHSVPHDNRQEGNIKVGKKLNDQMKGVTKRDVCKSNGRISKNNKSSHAPERMILDTKSNHDEIKTDVPNMFSKETSSMIVTTKERKPNLRKKLIFRNKKRFSNKRLKNFNRNEFRNTRQLQNDIINVNKANQRCRSKCENVCSLHDQPLSVVDLKTHVLLFHLPWFIQPYTACWTCKTQFLSYTSLYDHQFKNCHNDTFDGMHVKTWACFMGGILKVLYDVTNTKGLQRLLCWIRDNVDDNILFTDIEKQMLRLLESVHGFHGNTNVSCLGFKRLGSALHWKVLYYILKVLPYSYVNCLIKNSDLSTADIPNVLKPCNSFVDSYCNLDEWVKLHPTFICTLSSNQHYTPVISYCTPNRWQLSQCHQWWSMRFGTAYYTVGYHHLLSNDAPLDLYLEDVLKGYLYNNRCLGFSSIGLDFTYAVTIGERNRQCYSFMRLVTLALQVQKPISVYALGGLPAQKEAIQILSKLLPKSYMLYVHYTGECHIGIANWVAAFPTSVFGISASILNNPNMFYHHVKCFSDVEASRFLIESCDPTKLINNTGNPWMIKDVAFYIARLKNVPHSMMWAMVKNNFRQIYGKHIQLHY